MAEVLGSISSLFAASLVCGQRGCFCTTAALAVSLCCACADERLCWHGTAVCLSCPAGALAEENALAATLQVADAFDELMLAHKKEVHCNIITAEVRGEDACTRVRGGRVVAGM